MSAVTNEPPVYEIRRTSAPPPPAAGWDDPAWAGAATAEIAHFRPEGSSHRPRARVRLLYDGEGIHGLFHVRDRHVRCVRTRYGEPVWKDSCVEFFVEPRPGAGYLNFEFNCGGAWLSSHITDPARVPGGFRAFRPVAAADAAAVRVTASLAAPVEPELPGPLDWTLGFSIPFALLAAYAGARTPRPGDEWRGNFYKCGDETSHPHWAAWAPVDELNFHLPRCFGRLAFAL